MTALESSLRRRYGTTPEVLELIAAALGFQQRAEAARARVDADGLTIKAGKGEFRFFAHPCLATERESRFGFQKTLEALDRETRRRKVGSPTRSEQLPAQARLSSRAKRYLASPAA
jgi:hypothetical protein